LVRTRGGMSRAELEPRSRKSRAVRSAETRLGGGLACSAAFVFLYFTGHGLWIFPLLFFGMMPSVQAAVALYRARGADATPAPAPVPVSPNSKEKQVLRLARRRNGRVTAMAIAVDSSLSLKEAEDVLDAMVREGHVGMNIDDSGSVEYEFREFLPRSRSNGDSPAAARESDYALYVAPLARVHCLTASFGGW